MGYQHIENLYKNQNILLFKECYALEKIHGTSAHISYKTDRNIGFFSGGASHEEFLKLFNADELKSKLDSLELPEGKSVFIYGEAYGGKLQGMSDKGYGKAMRFVAFEVKIGDSWLEVPKANKFVTDLGLDFVPYVQCSTDITSLDAERDRPSEQAKKIGEGDSWLREGVVLRPLVETTLNNGNRIIAKYKSDVFAEVKTKREIDPNHLEKIRAALQKADEWVTYNRLSNILSHIPEPHTIQMTGDIIKLMIEDIEREGGGEIILTKEIKGQISRQSALMFKDYLKEEINGSNT